MNTGKDVIRTGEAGSGLRQAAQELQRPARPQNPFSRETSWMYERIR